MPGPGGSWAVAADAFQWGVHWGTASRTRARRTRGVKDSRTGRALGPCKTEAFIRASLSKLCLGGCAKIAKKLSLS